ncbi:MAG: DUF4124 domain-containing protein [Burkholderiaceae bacterium]
MARSSPQHARFAAQALTALVLAMALASSVASAALYKWVDANGRTVYSDQPPIGNMKTEVVGAAATVANPDAVKDMANKDAELKKRQTDRQDDAKKSEKTRAEAQKLATYCTQVRTQAAGLRRTDVTMFRLNEKGERVAMDEAARKAEADRLDQLVKDQKCPPP